MTESEVRRTTGLGRDAVRRIATETKAPKKKAPSL